MRPTLLLFALYAALVVTGMIFVATNQMSAVDVAVFLSPVSGIAAFAVGYSLSRR